MMASELTAGSTKATGDEQVFVTRRLEAEARAKKAVLGNRRHLASLPRRPQLAEPGSIELPRFVFTWLKNARDGNWTIPDLGVLVALLLSFENRDASIIAGARFEVVDGEPVLIVPGGVGAELRFTGMLGGDVNGSGSIRLRPALRTLVRNKWLAVEATVSETRIRRGERAKQPCVGTDSRGTRSA